VTKLLNYIKTKITGLLNRTPPISKQAKRVIPWFKDNGDYTHRLDYELDENSLVFDLGGYEGQWAHDIFTRYGCTIHIFEPFIPYAEKIKQRFEGNPKIFIHTFGLSNANIITQLSVGDDASSVFRNNGGETVNIELVEAGDFLVEKNIGHINLVKINIEGGEYDLLEHVIEKKLAPKMGNIQVQFHDFVPDAEIRMQKIQKHLQETHELTYQYVFVWENWALKK
jgi:FkbM family methyltransferase